MGIFSWWRSLFSSWDFDEYEPEMKYLIVGLGNIGPKYKMTRHNIGFEVLDKLAKEEGAEWKSEQLGDLTMVKHKGRALYLLKPSTYMNLSGKSVRYWKQKLKLQDEKLLVIVDDLNLDFGTKRLRGKGAAGGHNGLQDIQNVLGTTKYNRLRIGIGDSFSKGRQVDFVLGKWSKNELEELPFIIDDSIKCIKNYTSIGISRAMESCNTKIKK